ncbi:dihydroorotase [Vibrio astriarenae]|nr:dihydroorotase [Vibrio sp. C7]
MVALLMAMAPNAFAYDLVINNGRVMDPETGFDQVAHVAIEDGKIVEISKNALEGDKAIDAKGMVVAPGFIDTHSHVVAMPIMQNFTCVMA